MNQNHGLSAAAIKWIAFILMAIDHTGAALLEPMLESGALPQAANGIYTVCRLLGRGAFPLYLMLLVEGVKHTRSGKRYALRLLLCGLLSEAPFDLAMYGHVYGGHQNVLFTLAIGAASLRLARSFLKKESHPRLAKAAAYVLVPAAACLVCHVLRADYGALGILAVYALWFVSEKTGTLSWGFLAASVVLTISAPIEALSVAFTPLSSLYNGTKGRQGRLWYAAYPGHLLALTVLRYLLVKA